MKTKNRKNKLIILDNKEHKYLNQIFKGSKVYAFDVNSNSVNLGHDWRIVHDLIDYATKGKIEIDKITVVENYKPVHLLDLQKRYNGPTPIEIDNDKLIELKKLHASMIVLQGIDRIIETAVQDTVESYCEENHLDMEMVDNDETCAYIRSVYDETVPGMHADLSCSILATIVGEDILQ